MSDAKTPEPAVPATTTTPAEPVAVSESAPAAVAPAAPVVVERKSRAVGAWAFVLGLLTSLADIGFLVVGIVAVVGAIASFSSGDFSGVGTALGAAGLAVVALFVFFGGFVTAGLAALLGLVALLGGSGRVLGLFGLLFAAAAIVVRVLILSNGFSPDLG